MAIERKFVAQNLKEFRIKQFVESQLSRVGLSDIKLQRTPLGEKIIVRASRPGLVVGRAGSNIQKLTVVLKKEFNLENPQIEIEEIESIGLDANIIAEMIVNSMERFGSKRFKGVGHRALSDVMNAGALGVEILISGKVPSQRSRTWRFYQGYLKKCGDVAISGVNIAYKTAVLKSGVVGVKVSIMPPTTKLPDQIIIKEPDAPTVEEVTGEAPEIEEKVEEAEKRDVAAEKAPKKSAKKVPAKKGAKKANPAEKKASPKPVEKSAEKVAPEKEAKPAETLKKEVQKSMEKSAESTDGVSEDEEKSTPIDSKKSE